MKTPIMRCVLLVLWLWASPSMAQSDTTKVAEIMQMAYEYLHTNPEKSLGFAHDATILAKQLKHQRWIGKSLSLYGLYLIYNGEIEAGKQSLLEALPILEKQGSLEDLMEIKSNLAFYFQTISLYDTSIIILTQVVNLSQELKSIKSEEYARSFLSLSYLSAGYYENGIENNLKLLKLKERLQKSRVDVFTEIADIYAQRKDLVKAREYYLKALEECLKKENEPATLAFCYQNYGEILTKMDSLDKAYAIFNKALKYIEDNELIEEKTLIYYNMGICMLKQKKYNQAEAYFNLCKKVGGNKVKSRFPVLAQAGLVKIWFETQKDSLCAQLGKTTIEQAKILREKPLVIELSYLLAELHKRMKQPEISVEYLKTYIVYTDSLFWLEKESSIRDMHIKYDVEIKEAQNLKLSIENQLNQSRLNSTRITAAFLVFILILIFGAMIRFRNLNLQLDKRNRIISNQNEELVRLDKEKNFILSFITHDLRNLLQRLFGYFYIIREYSGIKDQDQFRKVVNGLLATEHEIKSLVNNTLDTQLLEEGKLVINITKTNINEIILSLIENLNYRAEQKNINVKTYFAQKDIFVYTDEVVLERILDNLISNAIKFSPFNSQITVSLNQDESHAKVGIQDQGPGFKVDELNNLFSRFTKLSAKPTDDEISTGLGLSIVKAMTEKLNIHLAYGNANPTGAFFSLSIPKTQNQAN
jgi:signal transduction histidine kinase/Tfp pilus assembly protein PilF